ncbi:hypothetical protein [Salinarimonas ramus]|uniref:Uncharacterized protein n=1 Tax=Salinarimonas ramus TaxID=690164 RepID=A0A917V693_9HYPH|nr:hypothetical protein [Salinarimonas ramus]GGK43821.1 hypothetical protein GCM10011322_33600 [Salinarimonas ramus]
MADTSRDRPNLKDEDVSRLRNRQRDENAPVGDGGPEGNLTQQAVWDDPGGEAHAYRAATSGAGGDASTHGELTARETPETTRRLSTGETPEDRKEADRDAREATDRLGQTRR